MHNLLNYNNHHLPQRHFLEYLTFTHRIVYGAEYSLHSFIHFTAKWRRNVHRIMLAEPLDIEYSWAPCDRHFKAISPFLLPHAPRALRPPTAMLFFHFVGHNGDK